MDKYKCCLCGHTFSDYGNNPWPLVNDDVSRCCDRCNSKYVVTARLFGTSVHIHWDDKMVKKFIKAVDKEVSYGG